MYSDVVYLITARFGPNWREQFSRALDSSSGNLRATWLKDEMEPSKLYCLGYVTFKPQMVRNPKTKQMVFHRARAPHLSRSPCLADKTSLAAFASLDIGRTKPYKSYIKMLESQRGNYFLFEIDDAHWFDVPQPFGCETKLDVTPPSDDIGSMVISVMNFQWKEIRNIIELVKKVRDARAGPCLFEPPNRLTQEQKLERKKNQMVSTFKVSFCCAQKMMKFFFMFRTVGRLAKHFWRNKMLHLRRMWKSSATIFRVLFQTCQL